MSEPVPFEQVARIPSPGDNVAIATRRLERGTAIAYAGRALEISHTVLEGHRFALAPIAAGEPLLSWRLPFGLAARDVAPGEYVCNDKIIHALRGRRVDFELPEAANFVDHVERYELDEARFTPGRQVPPLPAPGTFEGFARAGGRGAGTRNFVVVLATTSPSSGFARELVRRLAPLAAGRPRLDGVVAVTHTEGGGVRAPHNLEHVLRTLGGFMVHPNVAAVLAVDHPGGSFGNDTLRAFMRARGYPLDHVRHAFLTLDGAFDAHLERAARLLASWLPEADDQVRTPQPLARLKLALQCGGSDAFSGISGNALAGWVAKTLLRHGGSANLAETDELIGAEPYVLANVRDLATARAFLAKIEGFKAYASHHGTTAEGNPSGGNNYRGLYNIALKSIGAARKKDPEVRLDHVIDYGQPMTAPGYYFMDSPGNDLESIAGQVASGANLILFITGNGSITNFPFVPTLKFVTTTGRFELLANEMDVNAGRYNDGMPMDELGAETFELTRAVASGQLSKGELAGHSQVSIWRDWPQTDGSRLEAIRARPRPRGEPLAVAPGPAAGFRYQAFPTARGPALAQVGLVMPTSLCSGQPARLIAEHLNGVCPDPGIERYVALVHTEGCGSNNAAPLFLQTLRGHLEHRAVRSAVLLEHGCEQTHNDTVRQYLERHGLEAERFGWASVQLDGGLGKVRDKVAALFSALAGAAAAPGREPADAGQLSLGLTASGQVLPGTARLLGELARALAAAGATVVVPENAATLGAPAFRQALLADPTGVEATLAYGETVRHPGLHVMETPTENLTETLTGLGATGVDLMLCHVGSYPSQAHPMIPLLQVSADPGVLARYGQDLDLRLEPGADPAAELARLVALVADTACARYAPKLYARGVTEFQLTRGLLGLSM